MTVDDSQKDKRKKRRQGRRCSRKKKNSLENNPCTYEGMGKKKGEGAVRGRKRREEKIVKEGLIRKQ